MCICKRMYLFASLFVYKLLVSPVLYFSEINKNYQNTKEKKRKKKYRLKVARGYFLGTEVLFSKSSFGHVNLNRFF